MNEIRRHPLHWKQKFCSIRLKERLDWKQKFCSVFLNGRNTSNYWSVDNLTRPKRYVFGNRIVQYLTGHSSLIIFAEILSIPALFLLETLLFTWFYSHQFWMHIQFENRINVCLKDFINFITTDTNEENFFNFGPEKFCKKMNSFLWKLGSVIVDELASTLVWILIHLDWE